MNETQLDCSSTRWNEVKLSLKWMGCFDFSREVEF